MTATPTHLETVTAAYDLCGIVYALLAGPGGSTCLVLAGSKGMKHDLLSRPVEVSLRRHHYVEFAADGRVATY